MKPQNLFTTITLIAVIGLSLAGCDNGTNPSGGNGGTTATTYTVTFSANNGTGTAPNDQTVQAGSSITLPGGSGLTRSGFTFSGWNTNASGTGITYQGGDSFTPTGNITLYARWNDTTAPVYAVTVTPAAVTVAQGQTQQFTAAVIGNNNPAQTVTWAVTGGGNGTSISPSGLLTVAANESAATLTVRATSTVDTNQSGTATVTVTAPVPSVSWAVNDLTTWGDAVNGIRSGGANKAHIINVSADISVLVTPASENTFGSVTDITVAIEGSGAISPSGSGGLLRIGDGQTVTVKNLTLQGRVDNNSSVVRINSGGTFCMEGSASVTGNTISASGGGVYVNGGTFIMQDNASVTGNTVSASGGGVYVSGGTFIMKGNASVSGNTASTNSYNGSVSGGGVYVNSGTFTMESGAITGNTASSSSSGSSSYGGGVYINDSGTFTMQSGAITGNTASGGSYGNAYGGGVYSNLTYLTNVTITMQNGAISDNTVSGYRFALGGGVYGNVIMEDGAISNNTASATGSGIEVDAGGGGVCGALTMKGGTISGNTVNASSTSGSTTAYATGGGMRGSFTMQGGTISGNTVNASNSVNINKVEAYGGGVSFNTNTAFTKTSGTIYGNDAADSLKNIVNGGKGHAVSSWLDNNWRNATAGPTMNSDTYGFWLNETE